MRPDSARWRGTALAVAAAFLTAPLAAQGAAAQPAQPVHQAAAQSGPVAAAEERAARTLAASLSDPAWSARVRTAALASDGVDLAALAEKAAPAGTAERLLPSLHRADRRIAAAKGLDGGADALLQLRLGTDAMRDGLAAGAAPLVAAASADERAGSVTAYDSSGVAHTLDARTAPTRPVYVVGVDTSKALAAGLDVLRAELTARGLAAAAPEAGDTPAAADTRSAPTAASAGFWTTRISSVRLDDDQEPWIKGDAEIYSLVTGFGQDGKVRVDPVDMPYLDHDGETYYPDQILVNWSNYKYNLADAVMMEEDGGTNYRDLAKAIADALLTITDQGVYIPLVNAVLDAMPDDWWTDDPDYVDSWYTLARDDSGTLHGAAGNGRLTVEPYFVEEF